MAVQYDNSVALQSQGIIDKTQNITAGILYCWTHSRPQQRKTGTCRQ